MPPSIHDAPNPSLARRPRNIPPPTPTAQTPANPANRAPRSEWLRIAGKGELAAVGGPVTRQAVRLRILFRNGPPIDLVPLELGPQFPVKFYAVFYLQPAKTAWVPERVVAYDQAGRKIAECWTTTREGDVCDRSSGAPQPP